MLSDLRQAIQAGYRRIVHPMYVRDRAGVWTICPHCDQSCTGSYLSFICCTRCGRVVA